MTQITLEVPDNLISQINTKNQTLQDVMIKALENYLKSHPIDIRKTKTWELCGKIEISNLEIDDFAKIPDDIKATNYSENIDKTLYS